MIEDYIRLCKLFGGCYDLVQTNGGNISVKDTSKIVIKRSGFKMIETELNKGYVTCDINTIKRKLELNDENLQDSILFGEGTPSIETFFHLLPTKYVVHLHPTFLLHILCLNEWKEQLHNLNLPFEYLCIDYCKPGIELSKSIFEQYKNEKVIFLQNHGVILCDDSIDIIIKLCNKINTSIKKLYTNCIQTDIQFMDILNRLIPDKYIQSIVIHNILHDRYFYKLSPDLYLYLGEYPIIIESTDINIEKEIEKYFNKYNKCPTIVIKDNLVYCISDTYDALQNLKEMVATYYQVVMLNPNISYNEINNHIFLRNWDKEKLRLKH